MMVDIVTGKFHSSIPIDKTGRLIPRRRWASYPCVNEYVCKNMTNRGGDCATRPDADPGFLPGEGAKGLMTLYGMGMSDFLHTQTQICNFSRCFLPYYA